MKTPAQFEQPTLTPSARVLDFQVTDQPMADILTHMQDELNSGMHDGPSVEGQVTERQRSCLIS